MQCSSMAHDAVRNNHATVTSGTNNRLTEIRYNYFELILNQAVVEEVEFVMRSTMSFPARTANSTVSKPFSPEA